mmetsp:Transcript_9544/g.21527  ORF Transcript_9544/g.21527 Transcript_9544/m.21527 type:complete len:253 (-) Transcript_9544:2019-2777(-)
MKQLAATLISIVLVPLVASFVPSNTGNTRHSNSSTSLFGTIRFVGTANARLSTPPIIANDPDEDKSLSIFLTTSASDPVLLGTEGNADRAQRIDDNQSSSGELWEVKQGSVGWFGMTLVPIFVNQIEKNPAENPASGNVVISIIDAKTEIEQGGRFGNKLASVMKKSIFEGRNVVAWRQNDDASSDADALSYALEGDLKLTIEINLPPYLPIPPGFNAIGSKIVQRTCKVRLQQNLSDISDAYSFWATSSQQ